MKIYVSQVYIENNASYQFSHVFQQKMHRELTSLISPSPSFIGAYGENWSLIVNMSAKAYNTETRKKRKTNEICGPGIYSKDRQVEYTIFLPFDHDVPHDESKRRFALGHLFEGICYILKKYDIDTYKIDAELHRIMDEIIADPETKLTPVPWDINLV